MSSSGSSCKRSCIASAINASKLKPLAAAARCAPLINVSGLLTSKRIVFLLLTDVGIVPFPISATSPKSAGWETDEALKLAVEKVHVLITKDVRNRLDREVGFD